jgi:hypothetical protein
MPFAGQQDVWLESITDTMREKLQTRGKLIDSGLYLVVPVDSGQLAFQFKVCNQFVKSCKAVTGSCMPSTCGYLWMGDGLETGPLLTFFQVWPTELQV